MAKRTKAEKPAELGPVANPFVTAGLALLIPGAGHFFLNRRGRAMVYFLIVLSALAIGVSIDGRLPWQFSNAPLATLATLGALGSGLPCLLLRFGFNYTGDMSAAGYEYGGAFILTAGLMNLLLVLDAWDIALGKEEAAVAEPEAEKEAAQ